MPFTARGQRALRAGKDLGRALRRSADRIGVFVLHGRMGVNRIGGQRRGRHPLRGVLQCLHLGRRQHAQRSTDLLDRGVRVGNGRTVQHERAEIAKQCP